MKTIAFALILVSMPFATGAQETGSTDTIPPPDSKQLEQEEKPEQSAGKNTRTEDTTPGTPSQPSETPKPKVQPRQAQEHKLLGKIELVDAKKNYLILIDEQGKLFTFDLIRSMTATQVLASGTRQVPLHQIPPRSSATLGYRLAGDKKVLTRIEFRAPAAATAEKKRDPNDRKTQGDKKIQGDIGFVDVQKNQLVLVTKEGELVTLYFPRELAATQLTPSGPRDVAMNDLGIRSSVSIEYRTEGPNNLITKIEFREPYSQ